MAALSRKIYYDSALHANRIDYTRQACNICHDWQQPCPHCAGEHTAYDPARDLHTIAAFLSGGFGATHTRKQSPPLADFALPTF